MKWYETNKILIPVGIFFLLSIMIIDSRSWSYVKRIENIELKITQIEKAIESHQISIGNLQEINNKQDVIIKEQEYIIANILKADCLSSLDEQYEEK